MTRSGGPDAAGSPRFGLLVMTHGGLAFELVRALEAIVGPVERVRGLSIGWDVDLQQARKTIRRAIEEVDPGGGVLILTDMFGGTATNLTLSFLRDGIEVVTGVNLPMMIKFANIRTTAPLKEAAAMIRDQGQRSIALANEYLEPTRES
ncbi:MAG: PTS sugar transporter subunit IIA [Acidobacteriota bacterium]